MINTILFWRKEETKGEHLQWKGRFCLIKKEMWFLSLLPLSDDEEREKERQVYPLTITHLNAFSFHNGLVYGGQLIALFLVKYLIGRRKLLQRLWLITWRNSHPSLMPLVLLTEESFWVTKFLLQAPDVLTSLVKRTFVRRFLVLLSPFPDFCFGCASLLNRLEFFWKQACFSLSLLILFIDYWLITLLIVQSFQQLLSQSLFW